MRGVKSAFKAQICEVSALHKGGQQSVSGNVPNAPELPTFQVECGEEWKLRQKVHVRSALVGVQMKLGDRREPQEQLSTAFANIHVADVPPTRSERRLQKTLEITIQQHPDEDALQMTERRTDLLHARVGERGIAVHSRIGQRRADVAGCASLVVAPPHQTPIVR